MVCCPWLAQFPLLWSCKYEHTVDAVNKESIPEAIKNVCPVMIVYWHSRVYLTHGLWLLYSNTGSSREQTISHFVWLSDDDLRLWQKCQHYYLNWRTKFPLYSKLTRSFSMPGLPTARVSNCLGLFISIDFSRSCVCSCHDSFRLSIISPGLYILLAEC